MTYKISKQASEHKEAKKKRILKAAAKVFSVNGYKNSNMKEILAEADISAGSFYFYFSSKDELFETLFHEMNELYLNVIADAMEEIFEKPMECICKAITLALWSFQSNRELAKIMLIDAVGLNPHFEQKRSESDRRYMNILEEILKDLKAKKIIDVPDVKVAAISFMGSVYSIIVNWLHEEGMTNPVEYAFPLSVYSMQALNMDFDRNKADAYIKEILSRGYEEHFGGRQ